MIESSVFFTLVLSCKPVGMNIPVDPLMRTTGSDEGIFIRTRLVVMILTLALLTLHTLECPSGAVLSTVEPWLDTLDKLPAAAPFETWFLG